jgi:hypothetical protein
MRLSPGDRPVLNLGRGQTQPPRTLRIARQSLSDPVDWKKTETTRYLCAAAHLDEQFRNSTIRKLMKGKHRAIAVSYGVDMATVLKHCLVARSRTRLRNFVLALAIILTYLLCLEGLRSNREEMVIIALVLYFTVSFVAILTEVVIREHKTVRMNLSENNYNPDCVTWPGIAALTRDLCDARESNVMIYSGFSPFVGSGINVKAWSFAVDISRGKEELGRVFQAQPFEIRELYSEISSALADLNLGNLSIEDKLCVNGRDIRNDPRFLPNLLERPATQVSREIVEGCIDNPSTDVRHYKQIRLVDWSGELVLSIFLRLSKPGRNLFIETTYCLLTPVDQRYQKVDAMNPDPGIGSWLWTGFVCASTAAMSWSLWPLWVAAKLLMHHGQWLADVLTRKVIRKNPTFDRGAASSVREDVGSTEYQRYFQKLDKEMYLKILEQQIIDATVRFLDGKGIETTQMKERRTTILNSGVIVSGTMSVQGDTVAVGGQARAEKRETSRTAHA